MSSRPTAWTVAVVEHLNRTGESLTAQALHDLIPGCESVRQAALRLGPACATGFLEPDRDGAQTTYTATGKRHEERAVPQWGYAQKCPRVASVFHLAQGVQW